MTFSDYLTLAVSLLGVILVIFVAYYSSRWLGVRLANSSFTKGIRVLTRLTISQNKALMVVNVGEKYLLISVSDKQIEKLSDLDRSDVEDLLISADSMREKAMKPILPKLDFLKKKEESFEDYLDKAYKKGETEETK